MEIKDFINTEATEKEAIEGLEKLTRWANNLSAMPPIILKGRTDSADGLRELNREITDMYDAVDGIIFTYEVLISRGNSKLEQDHPRDKIHEMGSRCYKELNRRIGTIDKRARWYNNTPDQSPRILETNKKI